MLIIIFLLGITASVFPEECPSYEEVRPCLCENLEDSGRIVVTCDNDDDDLELKDLADTIKNLNGKKNVELMLDGFDLTKVPLDFFKGIEVVSLDIYNCEVFSVTKDDQRILVGMENSLEEFVVESSITENIDLSQLRFEHLRKLKRVEFSFNVIPEVTNTWFENSTIEHVVMVHNEIEKLGDKAFQSLNNLKELTLTGNDFGPIKRSMLPASATHLKVLELDVNAFTSLPDDIFSNMPSLSIVSLLGNEISRLEQNTWKSVWEQLHTVDLEENPLECDSHMEWTFDLRQPTLLEGTCSSPPDQEGKNLEDFIDDRGQ